jgi:hypothetical protein
VGERRGFNDQDPARRAPPPPAPGDAGFAEQSGEARNLDAALRATEPAADMTLPLVRFIFPALITAIFTLRKIRMVRVPPPMQIGR